MPPAPAPTAEINIVGPSVQPDARNVAVDAYRGFVMLLMMAEVLQLAKVAKAFPGNPFWGLLAFNQSHVEWVGCSLHDLIQPSFSLLVGVALPFSLESRRAKGVAFSGMLGRALWRSFLLVALGIFLRSTSSGQTNYTFEDTLTQIGLGYPFLFLLGLRSARWLWGAFAAILLAYWATWALYPLPGPGFDYAAAKVPPNWVNHFDGFAAHWNKNTNLGWAFDRWFLNLFPRPSPFTANAGGYLTLSFIPTLGTMILGLIAGRWLRAAAPGLPVKGLLLAGGAGIVLAVLLHVTGICPVVKRIWTPSWVLFSGGACYLLLTGFCWLIEARGYRRWAYPLVVIGTNSIAAYLLAHLCERFVLDSFRIHLGAQVFEFSGTALEPLWRGMAVLAVFWLILYWMYRKRIFLKL